MALVRVRTSDLFGEEISSCRGVRVRLIDADETARSEKCADHTLEEADRLFPFASEVESRPMNAGASLPGCSPCVARRAGETRDSHPDLINLSSRVSRGFHGKSSGFR